MSYNSTVDLNSLDLYNNLKYDQNPLYEKSLRNIKYLPYDDSGNITNKLVDDFNAMIVRKDTGYYEKSRSKKNYIMENSNILQSYRNELFDYINMYYSWINKLDDLEKSGIKSPKYDEYRYIIINYSIPEIIRLNKIIHNKLSIPDDVKYEFYEKPKYRNYLYLCLFLILIIIAILITNSKNYYSKN
jgi:hypothetical protein